MRPVNLGQDWGSAITSAIPGLINAGSTAYAKYVQTQTPTPSGAAVGPIPGISVPAPSTIIPGVGDTTVYIAAAGIGLLAIMATVIATRGSTSSSEPSA